MVSVLIPVYNTAKYLPQCLDSILNQSFTDLEIILVNDASTDNSLFICDKYKQKDKRVIVVDKPVNEGLEKARLTALKKMTGEYFCFVDSDDWLEKDAIRIMVERALQTGVDYVEIGMYRVIDRYRLLRKKGVQPVLGLIKQPELFDKYFLSFFGVNILGINAWGKLYKSQILEKMSLEPLGIVMGEDLYFNIKMFPYLQSIYIDSYAGYNYRFGGMTSRYNPALLRDLKKLYVLKKKLIEQYQYNKASDFIRIELKNVLVSDVKQRILFKYGSREEIINQLQLELCDPVYKDLKQVESDSFANSTVVKAIINRNAQQLYEIVDKRVRRERWKYEIKKRVSLLLLKL